MNPVFGIRFSGLDRTSLVHRLIEEPIDAGAGPRSIVTANVDHIVNLRRRPDFQDAYARAWITTADGMPVYLYARSRGACVPARLTGADLFSDLMLALSPVRHRCFFVASSDITGGALAAHLTARGFCPKSIAWVVPPFGFESDPNYSARLRQHIRDHGTTHLFFGVGSPKSEVWINKNRAGLGDCYAMAVGASLDFFVGQKRRSPRWVQNAGLEWSWRFAHEPRRMFNRYFVSSWSFLAAIRDDLAASAHKRRSDANA